MLRLGKKNPSKTTDCWQARKKACRHCKRTMRTGWTRLSFNTHSQFCIFLFYNPQRQFMLPMVWDHSLECAWPARATSLKKSWLFLHQKPSAVNRWLWAPNPPCRNADWLDLVPVLCGQMQLLGIHEHNSPIMSRRCCFIWVLLNLWFLQSPYLPLPWWSLGFERRVVTWTWVVHLWLSTPRHWCSTLHPVISFYIKSCP